MVRTRHQRQLSKEDGDQEEGEVGRRVENVHQCGHMSLDKRLMASKIFVRVQRIGQY